MKTSFIDPNPLVNIKYKFISFHTFPLDTPHNYLFIFTFSSHTEYVKRESIVSYTCCFLSNVADLVIRGFVVLIFVVQLWEFLVGLSVLPEVDNDDNELNG